MYSKEDVLEFLDKTYCSSTGHLYHEYRLLGAICGLKISKSALTRSGKILYVRNGALMSGTDMLINYNNGFKYLDQPDKSTLIDMLENFEED